MLYWHILPQWQLAIGVANPTISHQLNPSHDQIIVPIFTPGFWPYAILVVIHRGLINTWVDSRNFYLSSKPTLNSHLPDAQTQANNLLAKHQLTQLKFIATTRRIRQVHASINESATFISQPTLSADRNIIRCLAHTRKKL